MERLRLAADNERLEAEVALLREEMRIKDARMSRISATRRPQYAPVERMAILELKAARGWNQAQAARAFSVTAATIASWFGRLNEDGPEALLRLPVPVNRFPEFVRHLAGRLKVLCPAMGKVRIADVLARAGLHLGKTTVGRFLKRPDPPSAGGEAVSKERESKVRVVTAKYPNHLWNVDLTTVPTGAGFWVPWLPFSLHQGRPFCWWVVAIVDHFSRCLVGFAVFGHQPTSEEVCAVLDAAIARVGRAPKYTVTDHGPQFFCEPFKAWCKRLEIRPRFGAVGKHGSLALIERFIRTMKGECCRKILVPFRLDDMRREISFFAEWYNEYRPSMGLAGKTPGEVYRRRHPANRWPRHEPRPDYPRGSPCAAPQVPIRGQRGVRLELVVSFLEGRKHLPIVELKRVA